MPDWRIRAVRRPLQFSGHTDSTNQILSISNCQGESWSHCQTSTPSTRHLDRLVRVVAFTRETWPILAQAASVRQRHADLAVKDFDVVLWLTQRVIQTVLAVCHVELPAMPRTRHDLTVQCPFAQGTTRVRANAIQHVIRSVDVVDGKDTPFRHHFCSIARGDVMGGDEWNCSGHAVLYGLQMGYHSEHDSRSPKLNRTSVVFITVRRRPRGNSTVAVDGGGGRS